MSLKIINQGQKFEDSNAQDFRIEPINSALSDGLLKLPREW